jgi:hypothetical protein
MGENVGMDIVPARPIEMGFSPISELVGENRFMAAFDYRVHRLLYFLDLLEDISIFIFTYDWPRWD